MKKRILLFLIYLFSNVFILEAQTKSINYKNEFYFSIGLFSAYTFGESFLNYVSYKPIGVDTVFLYPEIPEFEIGYNHFISDRFEIGIDCNYEIGYYTTYNSSSGIKIKDEINHRLSVLGNISILFPKKHCILYIKIGAGTCIDLGNYWEDFIRVIPAIQFSPIGIKFFLTDDIVFFSELNFGMNSLLCIGLCKGF
ncbi:MAG: hypothetical protein J5710_00975 [Treponema sp.]|nr:hypothetical protein [Treponema sp.]MBR5645212.1 hypothetical protein [Treponema sp.]